MLRFLSPPQPLFFTLNLPVPELVLLSERQPVGAGRVGKGKKGKKEGKKK
jgi:hypothetical protein